MSHLHIYGASLFDATFDLETPEGLIRWNATKLRRDADAGLFGRAQRYAITELPGVVYENLEREKIEVIKGLPDVLNHPGIGIEGPPGWIFTLADGNHRITARKELGLDSFELYICPVEIEKHYRITIVEEQD